MFFLAFLQELSSSLSYDTNEGPNGSSVPAYFAEGFGKTKVLQGGGVIMGKKDIPEMLRLMIILLFLIILLKVS